MKSWSLLLGGLVAWAAHFFILYAIASLFPGRAVADGLVVLATLSALALAAWLLLRAWRIMRGGDELERWVAVAGLLGCALALVAIFYQGLPALIG